MGEKTVRDEIDRELSRTFFGGASLSAKPEQAPLPPSPPARTAKTRNIIIACSVAAAVVFFGAWFLIENSVTVRIAIRIQRRPVPIPQVKAPKSDKRPAISLAGIEGTHVKPSYSKELSKNDKTVYDFENTEEGWEIPSWEKDKPDHVASGLRAVEGVSAKGKGSLELYADFPGKGWTGALAEISQYLDLVPYDSISVDVYIPPTCPPGLKAKMILTVGDDWKFVEMSRGIKLTAGKWTTVTASLADGSGDWRKIKVDAAFRADVRKIAVRVESEKAQYTGPVYIDNVRVHLPRK